MTDLNGRLLPFTYLFFGPGVWTTEGGVAVITGTDPAVPSMAVLDTGRPDGIVGVDMATTMHGPGGVGDMEIGQGLVLRCADEDNYWLVKPNGIWKYVAGVPSHEIIWQAVSSPYRYEATLAGPVITVTRDGEAMGSVTDSFNATCGTHGLWRVQ